MAGSWIQMRTNLKDDPAVIALSQRTGLDLFAVVGRLHDLWSWFNENSTDGRACGVTTDYLDRRLQHPGFSEQLAAVGWLQLETDGVVMPRFSRYNSSTAKKRALTALRNHRKRLRDRDAVSVTRARQQQSRSTARGESEKILSNNNGWPADAALLQRLNILAAKLLQNPVGMTGRTIEKLRKNCDGDFELFERMALSTIHQATNGKLKNPSGYAMKFINEGWPLHADLTARYPHLAASSNGREQN
jgi:hypothetical protein